ncbi:MAG: hypothetical protein ACRD2T_09015 [Thermoanaerobaculia bacterium]
MNSPERGAGKRAKAAAVEIYPLERKAEFLLNNAADEDDYAAKLDEVCQMGLDPAKIPHRRP